MPLIDPLKPAPEETDGRRRRSQDSRARIVAAMLELIRGGEIAPGAEQVAARAQVGLRTVFRQFKDMDSLYREMSRVIEAELRPIIDRPLKGADWRERLVDLIARRTAAFEKIAPFKRASETRRHGSRSLEADNARLAVALRDILERELPPEIVADRLSFEALDLLMSWESWSRLRRDQTLSPRRAQEVLEHAVRRLFPPAS